MSDSYLPPAPPADPAPLPEPAPATPPARFPLPADYYSSPPSVKPLFPRWVPLSCGIASIFFLIAMFIGGAVVASIGMGPMFAFLLGRMQAETGAMYVAEVKPEQKKAFEAEFDRLILGVDSGKVSIARLQPVMQSLQDGIKDERLEPAEIDRLVKEMRDAHTEIPRKK